MRNDGNFSSTISKGYKSLSEYNKSRMADIYNLTYQATPWLETTFRYSGFQEYYHFDRSWEIKINIVEEDKIIPEISLGLRDADWDWCFSF